MRDTFDIYSLIPQCKNLLLTIASAGATRNALTKNMIETLEVPKPKLYIQASIADKLESLDKKSNSIVKPTQTLEEIAQAIFKSWFVDFEPPCQDRSKTTLAVD